MATGMWAASRVALALFTYAMMLLRPGGSSATSLSALASAWLQWDAKWYVQIAQAGYFSDQSAGFFPLYPLLIHLVGMALGGHYLCPHCSSATWARSACLSAWAASGARVRFGAHTLIRCDDARGLPAGVLPRRALLRRSLHRAGGVRALWRAHEQMACRGGLRVLRCPYPSDGNHPAGSTGLGIWSSARLVGQLAQRDPGAHALAPPLPSRTGDSAVACLMACSY